MYMQKKFKNHVFWLNVVFGSPKDADLAIVFTHIVKFQLTNGAETWSGKHLQNYITLCRFNVYLELCFDFFWRQELHFRKVKLIMYSFRAQHNLLMV